jgi:hypothetical protein
MGKRLPKKAPEPKTFGIPLDPARERSFVRPMVVLYLFRIAAPWSNRSGRKYARWFRT